MQLDAYAATDIGPVRENNEDAMLVELDAGLVVVADGMGGHAAGEVASKIVIDTALKIFLGADDPEETRLLFTAESTKEALFERLRYCLNQSGLRIRQVAEQDPSCYRMGTTAVIVLVEHDVAYYAHVGDSRLYLLRGSTIQQLTRDHTVVQDDVDAGLLTPEQARVAQHKNILTRSVSALGPVEADVGQLPLEEGDLLILCTDGLTDPLTDEQIKEITLGHHLEDVAQALVEAALAAGGEDNVTLVVLRAGA